MSERAEAAKAMESMLHGVWKDDPDPTRRMDVTHRLLNQGMNPEDLKLLIERLQRKQEKFRGGMLYKWLETERSWKIAVTQFRSGDTANRQLKKELGEIPVSQSNQPDHENTMTFRQRVFYSHFYDGRPASVIARDNGLTPDLVKEITRSEAVRCGVPARMLDLKMQFVRTEA